jgi:hypothetical protein
MQKSGLLQGPAAMIPRKESTVPTGLGGSVCATTGLNAMALPENRSPIPPSFSP